MRGKGKVHTQGILDGTQEDFNILWVLYLLEDTMRIPLVWRRWRRATSWIWYRCRGDSSAAFLGLIIVTAIIWFQIWHTLSILKQHYCGTEMPSTLSDQTLFTEKWNPTAKKKKKKEAAFGNVPHSCCLPQHFLLLQQYQTLWSFIFLQHVFDEHLFLVLFP